MLFSYRWLSDYVELPPGLDGAREVAGRLTAAGLAVETVEAAGDPADRDVRLDVDVTTNRPDAMCHLGLAREAAVLLGRPLAAPPADPARGGEPAGSAVEVVIEDGVGCPRYVAMVIRGVTVGPSPDWLRARLEAIGLRSINNVVDVTNFVLWETGQPLHAFDLAKIPPGEDGRAEIRVRGARAGAQRETLVTLDGVRRELVGGLLVIADSQRPIALAGVMGGLDSEVTGATTEVLLESAHFAPRAVRRTAAGLGMHTDASHRFERGADPEGSLRAAERAAALLAEIAGGTVAPGAVDVRGERRADWPPVGRLERARLDAFAGVAIDPADAERWLAGLGFALEPLAPAGNGWRVTAPPWRWYDFDRRRPDGGVWEQDLFEEVIRVHGYDAIPAALPAIGGSDASRTAEQERRERIRDHLAACGFAEAIHYAFLAREDDAALPALAALLQRDQVLEGRPLLLHNPISERYDVLRRSLLPNLVAAAGFNRRRGADAVRLFEIGHTFFRRRADDPAASSENLPVEVETVALVAGGAAGAPWDRPREMDLFALKGVVESLAEALGSPLAARPAELPGLVAGVTAELLTADGAVAGFVGRVDPGAVEGGPDESLPLYAAELVAARLGGGGWLGGGPIDLPSRFPTVAADLTLTHPLSVPWAEIAAAIEKDRPALLLGFDLKDRYTGEGVPEGAVNTTLSFLYGSHERSLTQDEVNASQQVLAARLQVRFGPRGSGEAR
jgi:phenylalanyl-tRNA synthetase beta chain